MLKRVGRETTELHFQLGDWQATLTAGDAAIELTPTLFAPEFHRAEALLAIDAAASADVSSEKAIASLERMLEIDPGHVAAATLPARLQAEHGQPDQAVDTLEAALEVVAEPLQAELDRRLPNRRRPPGAVSESLFLALCEARLGRGEEARQGRGRHDSASAGFARFELCGEVDGEFRFGF